MEINEKNSVENVNEEDFSEVAGGRKVNFFGMASEIGSYHKCDLCGKYGTVHLSNGSDACLDCLEKIGKIIGKDNTFKLIATNSTTQKEILSPPTPTSSNTSNTSNRYLVFIASQISVWAQR